MKPPTFCSRKACQPSEAQKLPALRISTITQRGAALLIILLIALLFGLGLFFSAYEAGSDKTTRLQKTHETLAEAKAALLGRALSRASDDIFGLLLLPDMGIPKGSATQDKEGTASGDFLGNLSAFSQIGRLPWRSLGLQPLRDAHGECLWYVVSGAAKNTPIPSEFNWDSVGHFELFRSDGTPHGTLAVNDVSNTHERPIALIFAPGAPLSGQDRRASGAEEVSECGGNYNVRNYLDAYQSSPSIKGIQNYFTGSSNNASGDASHFDAPKAFIGGIIDDASSASRERLVNDQIISISTQELFNALKQHPRFKSHIDQLLDSLSTCLNGLLPINLPGATGQKGMEEVLTKCTLSPAQKHWQSNLLYTQRVSGNLTGNFSIKRTNTQENCQALLIFAGERTTINASLSPQMRSTESQRSNAAMYLEGVNAVLFPGDGEYVGEASFDPKKPSADVIACITGFQGAGKTQISFNELADFSSAGSAGALTIDLAEKTVSIGVGSPANRGACLWSSYPMPLKGKNLRVYYDYQFGFSDVFSLDGKGRDRGYGTTFQLVQADLGDAPDTCGSAANMGVLLSTNAWGALSYVIETDVHRAAAHYDPAPNHVAILLGSDNLKHLGLLTTSCDGTRSACLFAPANRFEESPTPLWHSQRIEIESGCNDAECSTCAAQGDGQFALIKVWIDCGGSDPSTQCSDLTRSFSAAPNALRCTKLPEAMESVYFGLTGGFASGAASRQSVMFKNLRARSD